MSERKIIHDKVRKAAGQIEIEYRAGCRLYYNNIIRRVTLAEL